MNDTAPTSPSAGGGGRNVAPDHEVVVVGAGFSGLGVAIELKRAGFEDLVILDRGDDVGGAWRTNTYPGLAVDVPSIAYSFHFDMNPDWSRIYAPGPELLRYAQDCADKFGLRPHLRLNTEVVSAVFDEQRHLWRLRIADGSTITARFVFSCHGLLVTPREPPFAGMDEFGGKVLRSMDWDHSYDLEGKRVAVIGTGATGLQIIPTIAPTVQNLTVYQRTPIWVVPKPDVAIPALVKAAFRYVPGVQRSLRLAASVLTELVLTISVVHHKQVPIIAIVVQRVGTAFLDSQISDPDLREKLLPTYKFGCKRPSFSNTYYRTFQRDNVELVTEPIDRFTPTGIRTVDGLERELDAVVLATGFKIFDVPYHLQGTGGVSLNEFWDRERRQTYEGISVHGWPNLFVVPGPYAVSGSWFSTIDLCVSHGLRVLKEARRRGATRVEISRQAQEACHADDVRRAHQTIYQDPGCSGSNSYYIDQHGDAPFLRPTSTVQAWLRQRNFSLDDYEYAVRADSPTPATVPVADALADQEDRRLSRRG